MDRLSNQEVIKMNCVFCGGKVESKEVMFTCESEDQVILVRKVPAEVCTHCGEKTYSPKITDELLKFAKRRFKPVKTIETPVFDYMRKVAVKV